MLGNLLQLKKQFGISLVYITHDLTTAYQISDRIIVLYQGDVVENGDPEQIIRNPQHPYTQLLIRSIPEPNPDRHWAEEDDEEEEEVESDMHVLDRKSVV